MTDHMVDLLVGSVIAVAASWFFYYRGESKNVRREAERQKRESELPVNVTKYTWENFVDGARKVGKFILTDYKPDAILIFSGSSSIFSNLVLYLCMDRETLLTARIYTAKFISKNKEFDPTILRGYEVLESSLARFDVLLPEIFKNDGDRKWRIAIIDDTTTTGMSMQLVRDRLAELGYANVRAACFTCITRKNFNVQNPIDFAYQYTTTNDYLFPWGKKPI